MISLLVISETMIKTTQNYSVLAYRGLSVLLNMSMGQSVTLHDGTIMSIFKDVNQLAVLIEFYKLNHFITSKNICF